MRSKCVVHEMFRLSLCLAAALFGCTSDLPPDASERGEDEARCERGDEQECTCGTQSGVSVCSKAGEFGDCRCSAKPNDGKDAGARDASQGVVKPDAGKPGVSKQDAGDADSDGDAREPAATDKSPDAAALPCDVAALFTKHCGECHGQKTAYGAPMSLVSWSDLQAPAPKSKGKKAFEVALARVQDDARPMPPAPHARLSTAEIAKISAWVERGTPKGSDSCEGAPTTPGGGEGAVPKPDDCEQEYVLRAHGGTSADDPSKFKTSANPALEGNQYHCFYFDPPYASDAAMFWFEPLIDNKQSIHHWILYATDNKTHASGSSAGCNAAEPGAYFVAGWAPGANNTTLAKDVALQLPSGPRAGLILEVHYYNNTGKAQEDGSGIRFCTGKKSKRAHLAAVHTLGSEGICLNPGVDSEVAGTCVPRQDQGEAHIVGIWPHMHKLARRMKLTVKRKGGGSEVIHDAPFDFNAQVFHSKQDVVIRAGDTIETRCYFRNDTSSKVHYGERTQDEMCYAFVMAWPPGALANAPSPLANPATDLLNRCADPLSILQSCNGLNDRPVNVDHP